MSKTKPADFLRYKNGRNNDRVNHDPQLWRVADVTHTCPRCGNRMSAWDSDDARELYICSACQHRKYVAQGGMLVDIQGNLP
jgi:transcription elongation factor Elf1